MRLSETPRKNIPHFIDMKPVDFYELCCYINRHGCYPRIDASLKVDGFSFRFGKDFRGLFFVETGRSGYIYDGMDFIDYTKSKQHTREQLVRAYAYKNLFDLLEHNFSRYISPNTKIVCEILLNSLAEETEDALKFVHIPYEKQYLGKIMTICIIDVISPNGYKPILPLLHLNSEDIRIHTTKFASVVLAADIPFYGEIDPMIMLSRKKIDKPKKMEYNTILGSLKENMAQYLYSFFDSNQNSNFLGKTKEGFILNIGGFGTYKITSPEFRKAMNDNRQRRAV